MQVSFLFKVYLFKISSTNALTLSISASFNVDLIVTVLSHIVIFFMFSTNPFIALAAHGAHEPFSTSPTVLFW